MTDATLLKGLEFLLLGHGWEHKVTLAPRSEDCPISKGVIVTTYSNPSACGEPVQIIGVLQWCYSRTDDPMLQEVILTPLNGIGEEVGAPSRPIPLFNVRQALLDMALESRQG
jgi:hypothetical protein